MEKAMDNPILLQSDKTSSSGKKVTVDKKDSSKTSCKDEPEEFVLRNLGNDPRFQQQNQTQRCFVMYTDFYRCEHILGEGTEACTWFKDVFTAICPNDWVRGWDELRVTGRLPWHKYRTQGDFPGNKYGD